MKTVLQSLLGWALASHIGTWLCAQQVTTNDLWDVSQGVIVTTNSPLLQAPDVLFDPRDILGGTFGYNNPGVYEYGNAVFADGNTNGFVHFLEWQTPAPITVRSFKLWAAGDNDPMHSREFSEFRLLATSPGGSNFDKTLFVFTPNHPYSFVAGAPNLLIATDVKPFTAQEFRAEFVNRTNGAADGPRIAELDGFASFIGPHPTIRVSEVEVCWPSVSNLVYQVEYRDEFSSNQWITIGSPIIGNGSLNCIRDPVLVGQAQRFYRVRALE